MPQAILAPLTGAAIFLVLTIDPGGEQVCRDLLSDWSSLRRAVGFRVPGDDLVCIAAIGSQAWDRLFAGPRPAELHPFRELAGERHHAVSTPGDLLFHIRHERMDPCVSSTTVTAPASRVRAWEANSKHRSIRSCRMWNSRSPGVDTA